MGYKVRYYPSGFEIELLEKGDFQNIGFFRFSAIVDASYDETGLEISFVDGETLKVDNDVDRTHINLYARIRDAR